ncbi:hypothetical protein C1H76_0551 [Elsinoe australis]|uniref:Uncharacterized protein n=1 Tax=Elsinoe australis TaxID=40998 RepID=A0A4U7BGD2_9PEZI|nr:hypothetical protein C1H76_0551 [Elsinoe australis]
MPSTFKSFSITSANSSTFSTSSNASSSAAAISSDYSGFLSISRLSFALYFFTYTSANSTCSLQCVLYEDSTRVTTLRSRN